MTVNLNDKGLKDIIKDFDLFYIDIWGVLHNGIKLNDSAVNVLSKLDELGKEYILLTNAPRPNKDVIKFLKKLGLDEFKSSKVYTSGQGSLNYLNNEKKGDNFFHIGPERDFGLFEDLKSLKKNKIESADYLLCTGLFDENNELDFYEKLLSPFKKIDMVCTNPDLIVDRGDQREYCAGTIAKHFEDINGEVIYFGKPYPPVYELAATVKDKKILCIGDNLNTDIKGAMTQNFDSLLITGGIHRQEISNFSIENVLKNYDAKINYFQSELKW